MAYRPSPGRRRPRALLLALAALTASIAPSLARAGEQRQTRDDDTGERVAWLADNAIAVSSVDPADDDFGDLRPLVSVLGTARVVVLGEATHGDGTTFLAKTRLVRFLHREMGFDVLVFESGFYDCWKAWQRIAAGGDPDAELRRAVFPIWTRSAQVQPLIEHFVAAARSPRPLELAGIDPQFTGEAAERELAGELALLAARVGMDGEEVAARIARPLANLATWRYESGELPPPAERSALIATLGELERRLRRHEGAAVPEREFWQRLLASTADFAASSWATDFDRPLLEQGATYGVRERLMGEQLVWLARERYPGRRMIVWMHSGHAFRGLSGIDVPSPVHARLYRTLRTAGDVARAELREELYVTGVLAYQGSFATVFRRGPPEELLRPTAGSLEDLFHRTGLRYAFLDLNRRQLPRWLRRPLIARPVGYKEMKARWSEVFDGLLYIDRMEPSLPSRSAMP